LSSPFCILKYFDWNVRVSHLPQIHSEVKRSYTVDTYHKSLIRSIILQNSISWKYHLPSKTLINYIFCKFLFRDTTLGNYVSCKFLPEAHQYRTTPSVNPFPVTKHFQSQSDHFQKKSTTTYISHKSLFRGTRVPNYILHISLWKRKKYRLLALIPIEKQNNAEFQTAQGRFHYPCLHERIGHMFFNKSTLILCKQWLFSCTIMRQNLALPITSCYIT